MEYAAGDILLREVKDPATTLHREDVDALPDLGTVAKWGRKCIFLKKESKP